MPLFVKGGRGGISFVGRDSQSRLLWFDKRSIELKPKSYQDGAFGERTLHF